MKKPIRYSRFLLVFLFLSRILLPQTSYAQEKRNSARLIGGIVLTAAGIFLVADGFAQIETSESKSRPGLDISNWHWTSYTETGYAYRAYHLSADGTVKNAGKVPLDNVVINVKYYDSLGYIVTTLSTKLDTYGNELLPVGATDTWSTSRTLEYPGPLEPTSAEISATYDYRKQYENKSNFEGYAGIAMVAVGVYFIVDYLGHLGPLAKLEEKGINLKVVNKPGTLYLLASAKLF